MIPDGQPTKLHYNLGSQSGRSGREWWPIAPQTQFLTFSECFIGFWKFFKPLNLLLMFPDGQPTKIHRD
jgi:hypothetical protein